MITDQIDNARLYAALGPRIAQALDYLQQTDLGVLEPGRYEVEGASLYVLVQEYSTKPMAQGRWETHRRYIDVQSVVRGIERIGYAPAVRLVPEPYDQTRDLQWWIGDGEFLTLTPGTFMMLWPGEAHMPGMAAGDPSPVKKTVIKIAL
jgi:YhcH/YjgK/YiaL family protein